MTTAHAPRVETTAPKGRDARAAMLLAVYLGLGPDRSIEKAMDICAKAGLRISLTTGKNYSRTAHFVERAAEFDKERERAQTQVVLADAISTDVQQMGMARLLQQYGEGVLRGRLFEDGGKPKTDLTGEAANDAIRAMDVSFRMQRLINGQATEIHASITQFYGLIVHTVGGILQEAIEEQDRILAAAGVPEDLRNRGINALKAHYSENAQRALLEHYRALGMDTSLLDDPGPAGTITVEERE